MGDVLDLNLDDFDLEDVMTTSGPPPSLPGTAAGSLGSSASMSGATKTVSISPTLGGSSRPSSVPVGGGNLGPTSRSQSVMPLGDDFGLDMLADPGKLDDVKPASPPKPSGGGIFGNLFGGSNNDKPPKPPTPLLGNNSGKSGGLFGGGSGNLDLDKEMADLDAGLNANLNKAAKLGANISRPPTSVGMSGGGGSMFGQQQPSSMTMTYEEMEREKFKLLQQFERLKKKGVKIPKIFSMQSDYDEMKNEYEALENQRRMDISVRMQRMWLLNAVNGIEALNSMYDPFSVDLDGWGESLNEDLLTGDYDDIFEELYEKYKGYGNYPPEIRLILGVAGSAFAFHMQKRLTDGLGINSQQILRDNPHIARQMEEAARNSMSQEQPGLSKFMGLFSGGRGGDKGPPPFPGGGRASDIPDLNTVLNS